MKKSAHGLHSLGFIGWFGLRALLGSLRPAVFGMSHLQYATVAGIPYLGLGASRLEILLTYEIVLIRRKLQIGCRRTRSVDAPARLNPLNFYVGRK